MLSGNEKFNKYKRLIKNTVLLYGLTFAKLIFPLITLPYLTRVLSTDGYGLAVYVKSCMSYVQLIVDFGFMLSGTKEIVELRGADGDFDWQRVGRVVGDTVAAKLILAVLGAVFIFVLSLTVPLLREHLAFTWLYFIGTALAAFLLDFFFRGIERMGMITVSFVVTKGISTALTLVLVKGDGDLMMIPLLEIAGSLAAIIVVAVKVWKMKLPISFSAAGTWLRKIKESFVYFISDIATTAFGALNTVLVGIFLPVQEVALWSVALQLVSAVQQMYSPIMTSLYPHMIVEKSRKLLKNVLKIFMPLVTLGCIFCIVCAKWIILIVSGAQYVDAIPVFRALVPVMFISFPAILFGWPTLGAIGKVREVTISTILAAVIQVLGLLLLCLTGRFTLMTIAVCRAISEASMFAVRYKYYYDNRRLFCD